MKGMNSIKVIFLLLNIMNIQETFSESVPASGMLTIDQHGVCQEVSNGSTRSLFVPTLYTLEWSSFRTNPPPFVTLNSCPISEGTWNTGEGCVDMSAACPGNVAPSGTCSPIGTKCTVNFGVPTYWCVCVAAFVTYTCI